MRERGLTVVVSGCYTALLNIGKEVVEARVVGPLVAESAAVPTGKVVMAVVVVGGRRVLVEEKVIGDTIEEFGRRGGEQSKAAAVVGDMVMMLMLMPACTGTRRLDRAGGRVRLWARFEVLGRGGRGTAGIIATDTGDIVWIGDGDGFGMFVLNVMLFSVDLFVFLEILGTLE
jgi:hypothetical protein